MSRHQRQLVLDEIVRGELAPVSRADLGRRFEGRGPSRSTTFRAIDDALALADEHGIQVKIGAFQNQWSNLQPEGCRPHPTSAEAIEGWRDLDWEGLGLAIAEIGVALQANRRGSHALAEGIAKLRNALGGSDTSATRIVDLVLSVLRSDQGATAGLINVLERIRPTHSASPPV